MPQSPWLPPIPPMVPRTHCSQEEVGCCVPHQDSLSPTLPAGQASATSHKYSLETHCHHRVLLLLLKVGPFTLTLPLPSSGMKRAHIYTYIGLWTLTWKERPPPGLRMTFLERSHGFLLGTDKASPGTSILSLGLSVRSREA